MPFKKINTKEETERACKNNPKLRKELKILDIEYQLIKQVHDFRESKNITQKQVAEITGFTQQVVSRMEKIGHSPSLRNFIKYIDVLGLEIKLVEKNRE